jgi:HAMP domain-containing protein
MSKQLYSDQEMIEYLLGSLPEAEAERFGELSITDDEFVDALKVAENDLVDAYVQGELSGETVKQFELHYLATPLRREKVDFAQAFQVLARKKADLSTAVEAQKASEPRSKRKRAGWLSMLNILAVPRPALQWGLATVAIVLLVAGGLLLFKNVRLQRQISQTEARRSELQRREQQLQRQLEDQRTTSAQTEQELARVREERAKLEAELRSAKPQTGAIASFILTPQLRGAGQIKTITIPAGTEHVTMQLQLDPNEYSNYSVALLDQLSHQILWRSGRIRARGAADSKSLSVSFPANLLRAQTYSLRVSGVSSTGDSEFMSDYPFKVVK